MKMIEACGRRLPIALMQHVQESPAVGVVDLSDHAGNDAVVVVIDKKTHRIKYVASNRKIGDQPGSCGWRQPIGSQALLDKTLEDKRSAGVGRRRLAARLVVAVTQRKQIVAVNHGDYQYLARFSHQCRNNKKLFVVKHIDRLFEVHVTADMITPLKKLECPRS